MKKNKELLNRIVNDCKNIAWNYINNWEPLDPNFKIIEGCAYSRLSTEEQVEVAGGSFEQQIHINVSEALARSKQDRVNYKIVHFFIEPGVSGRVNERKELQAMMKLISAGKFKFVVFKEISRLTRDSTFWKGFFKLCHDKNCKIIIRGLPFDPNDPAAILQLDIMASVAEYESRNTSKRITESVRSAMKTSGKFNSTHRRLGLEKKQTGTKSFRGLYQHVPDEIEKVKFIFKTFCRYASHNKTLEVLDAKGIKNWNGENFNRHSLINLLTDKRYISKWDMNSKNRDMNQDELSVDKRCIEVPLPHDPVIDVTLWAETQNVLNTVSGNLGKSTRVIRIYPLSGILSYHDGTPFSGSTGHGRTQESQYYYNKENKLRIRADVLESEVAQCVAKLIGKTPTLQKAIAKAGAAIKDQSQLLHAQLKDLNAELTDIQNSKTEYLNSLSGLIKGVTDPIEINEIREAFKKTLNDNQNQQDSLISKIVKTKNGIESLGQKSFCWSEIAMNAVSVQQIIKENDPLALKRAYYSLFESIVVGPENEAGHRAITLTLKDGGGAFEDALQDTVGMVEVIQFPQPIENSIFFKQANQQ